MTLIIDLIALGGSFQCSPPARDCQVQCWPQTAAGELWSLLCGLVHLGGELQGVFLQIPPAFLPQDTDFFFFFFFQVLNLVDLRKKHKRYKLRVPSDVLLMNEN